MGPSRSQSAAIAGVVFAGAALLSLALPQAGAETPAPPSPPPHLQGSWLFDPDLSAKVMKDLPAEEQSSGGGRGGGRRGGGGGGGGMGSGSHGGSGGNAQGWDASSGGASSGKEEGGASRKAVLAALDNLTIAQTADQITITTKDGHARVLKPDGAKRNDETAPGGPTQLKAAWDKDGALVVEVKPDKVARRTESYVVSDDGKHLYLTVSFSGGFMARDTKIIRAYDAVATPAPAEASPTPKPSAPPLPPG
jgi:hypothetical protein